MRRFLCESGCRGSAVVLSSSSSVTLALPCHVVCAVRSTYLPLSGVKVVPSLQTDIALAVNDSEMATGGRRSIVRPRSIKIASGHLEASGHDEIYQCGLKRAHRGRVQRHEANIASWRGLSGRGAAEMSNKTNVVKGNIELYLSERRLLRSLLEQYGVDHLRLHRTEMADVDRAMRTISKLESIGTV